MEIKKGDIVRLKEPFMFEGYLICDTETDLKVIHLERIFVVTTKLTDEEHDNFRDYDWKLNVLKSAVQLTENETQ